MQYGAALWSHFSPQPQPLGTTDLFLLYNLVFFKMLYKQNHTLYSLVSLLHFAVSEALDSCLRSLFLSINVWRCEFDPWVGKIPWRRAWQPTPVFLPGESHGQRSLVGYSPWGHRESDDWVHACTHTSAKCLRQRRRSHTAVHDTRSESTVLSGAWLC